MDLQAMLAQMQGGQPGRQAGPAAELPQNDTGEQIYISSLALLKMMKHC